MILGDALLGSVSGDASGDSLGRGESLLGSVSVCLLEQAKPSQCTPRYREFCMLVDGVVSYLAASAGNAGQPHHHGCVVMAQSLPWPTC